MLSLGPPDFDFVAVTVADFNDDVVAVVVAFAVADFVAEVVAVVVAVILRVFIFCLRVFLPVF
jgi:hypothetical protein